MGVETIMSRQYAEERDEDAIREYVESHDDDDEMSDEDPLANVPRRLWPQFPRNKEHPENVEPRREVRARVYS
jgi:hypothetical protein